MPSPSKTPGKVIQEKLIAILTDAIDELKVDERDVSIIDFVPDETFSQKSVPLIVVLLPEIISTQPNDGVQELRIYGVKVALLDTFKPDPDGVVVARNRLDVFHVKLVAALRAEPYLTMAFMHCYESKTSWNDRTEEEFGSNLLAHTRVYEVPVMVEKDQLFE